jgi:hypothetical protein
MPLALAPPRPLNLAAYKDWLRTEHGVEVDERAATYYESVALKLREDFERSEFWQRLLVELAEFDAEYQVRTSYVLLMTKDRPRVLEKSFDSFFLKTFRRNVRDNLGWPNPPKGGWLLPDNWYERVNDIVRTSLVVKYLDGVEFLAEKVVSLASECGLRCTSALEARMEGYYAAHISVRGETVVPKLNWETTTLRTMNEIQVTTQLQDVIRRLLHRYYDDRRSAPRSQEKWQWEYESDEFLANYLGHILHYVEGMIMEVRERQSTDYVEELT